MQTKFQERGELLLFGLWLIIRRTRADLRLQVIVSVVDVAVLLFPPIHVIGARGWLHRVPHIERRLDLGELLRVKLGRGTCVDRALLRLGRDRIRRGAWQGGRGWSLHRRGGSGCRT